MKKALKFILATASLLVFASCGNDKKSENDTTDGVLVEERMMDQKEMDGMETMNGTETKTENATTSEELKVDNATLAFEESSSKAVWDAYNKVRLALIASNAAEAKTAAANLAMIFDESIAGLKEKAEAIATTDDLDQQRLAFSQFSNAVESYFKGTLKAGTLYKQHCPMAFDGKGADWLSHEAAIKNPYYGDKMLNCGSVTATITN